MIGFQSPTPKKTVTKTIQEIDKVISLKGKKLLDFGCGEDERIGKEAKKLGAKSTGVDKYFGKKIDGFEIDWKDFDLITFSYGTDGDDVIIERPRNGKPIKVPFDIAFGLKARKELKKDSRIAILFTKSDFLMRTKNLPTSKKQSANAFPYLKAVGEIKHIGGEFDMYLQIYKT